MSGETTGPERDNNPAWLEPGAKVDVWSEIAPVRMLEAGLTVVKVETDPGYLDMKIATLSNQTLMRPYRLSRSTDASCARFADELEAHERFVATLVPGVYVDMDPARSPEDQQVGLCVRSAPVRPKDTPWPLWTVRLGRHDGAWFLDDTMTLDFVDTRRLVPSTRARWDAHWEACVRARDQERAPLLAHAAWRRDQAIRHAEDDVALAFRAAHRMLSSSTPGGFVAMMHGIPLDAILRVTEMILGRAGVKDVDWERHRIPGPIIAPPYPGNPDAKEA